LILAAGACVTVVLAGCGTNASPGATVPLPASGRAYRALDEPRRDAVAATCRDRAAANARGIAARQLRAIDPRTLRRQLDLAYLATAEQSRPVAAVCAEAIPFVTPGLRVSFAGAIEHRAGTFTVQTTSKKPLTIRGLVTPGTARGRVLARREAGTPMRRSTAIGPGGRFAFHALRLRHVADNTFTLTIHAPPNAPRKLLFSAICLDCLSGGPPPTAQG
jgi:hypothetical protein